MKDASIFDAMNTGQSERAFEQQAVLAGAYYNALLEAKIPEELAQAMLMDYSNRFWETIFRGKHEC
jgi:hypothetical protein